MTDLVQEYLRGIRTSLEGLHQKVDGLTERICNVEQSIAHLYANVAEQSVRIDRLSNRVDRIERRLELAVQVFVRVEDHAGERLPRRIGIEQLLRHFFDRCLNALFHACPACAA